MYLFKRRPGPPAIQLFRSDGEATPLHVTFRNGEIHINPDAMAKGNYQLKISQGEEEVLQSFSVS